MREKTYYCHDCGSIFEEPVEIVEDPSPRGVGLPPGVIVTEVCPVCGSGWFNEAERCPSCGDWHKPNTGLSALCPDCKAHIDAAIDECICWVRDQDHRLDYDKAKTIVHLYLEDIIEV